MKVAVAAVVVALAGAAVAFAIVGIRPFRTPDKSFRIDPAAGDYWIEVRAGARVLRHKWGGTWDLPSIPRLPADRESGSLAVERAPGLDRSFLILRSSAGPWMLRYGAWEMRGFGRLHLAAHVLSAPDSIEAHFEDVDGDGREELVESHHTELLDLYTGQSKIVRVDHRTCHAWTGERFEPRWKQLEAAGVRGELVPLNEPP